MHVNVINLLNYLGNLYTTNSMHFNDFEIANVSGNDAVGKKAENFIRK